MKVVGIKTVGRSLLFTNYGSFLQHYCLRAVIKELGLSSCRILDNDEKIGFVGFVYDFIRLRLLGAIRSLRHGASSFKKYQTDKYQTSTDGVFAELRFRLDYSRFVGDDHQCSITDFSIVVAGGDQVWWSAAPEAWLTRYIGVCPCISYAVSADWKLGSKDADWMAIAKASLPKYQAVSVRENLGRQVLNDAVQNVSITKVIDPVLLCSRSCIDKMASSDMTKKRYLLAYFVGVKSGDDINLPALQSIAKTHNCGLRIVAVNSVRSAIPKQLLCIPSPSRFVTLVKEASYVITNSYHGTLLGVLYNKDFVSILKREGEHRSQNTRVTEFVTQFGLAERVVSCVDFVRIESAFKSAIDWDGVNGRISSARTESLNWLRNNLSKESL